MGILFEEALWHGSTQLRSLDGVNSQVEQWEFVSIVGTSGSGRSPLFAYAGRSRCPTPSTMSAVGKQPLSLRDEELAIFRRRKIDFVFHHSNLAPVLNVYENIVLPRQLNANEADKVYISRLVETLALGDRLQNLSNTLSAVSSSGWSLPTRSPPSPPFY